MLSSSIGGQSMCVAQFLGEITNPLQSLWFISKIGNHLKLYNFLSTPFTICFMLIRVIVLPPIVYEIILQYYYGAAIGKLSYFNYYIWSAMCASMMVGGWIWSYKLVKGLIKFRNKFKKI